MSGSTPRTSVYQLTCTDPVLAEALRRWLDDSGLAFPGAIDIDARLVAHLPSVVDQREVFQESGVDIQAGPPEHSVLVRWTHAPAMALVDGTRPSVTLWLTPAALEQFEMAERSFLLVVLVFVLRRLGWYHAHGAALRDPSGRGWMLVGNSKTGKSTTTALLASEGWGITTDDIAFLEPGPAGIAVRGFRSPIALREAGEAMLAAQGRLPSEGRALGRRQKSGYTPEALGGPWLPLVVPEVLLFPTIGAQTAIQPIRPAEVLAELVMWSRWVLYESLHAQQHLDALSHLATQCRCYRATIGPDLMRHPPLLQELVP